MIAALLLSCGTQEPPTPPAPTPSALNMNPSTLEVAAFEMTEVIGARWSDVDGGGWLDICFVRHAAPPASTTDCSVEQFTMVDGSWFLRVHHSGETNAHRIVMVSMNGSDYILRLAEGEARFTHSDRSSGIVEWKTPDRQGLYQR